MFWCPYSSSFISHWKAPQKQTWVSISSGDHYLKRVKYNLPCTAQLAHHANQQSHPAKPRQSERLILLLYFSCWFFNWTLSINDKINLHSIAKNVLEMILKQVLIPKHMDFSVLVTLCKPWNDKKVTTKKFFSLTSFLLRYNWECYLDWCLSRVLLKYCPACFQSHLSEKMKLLVLQKIRFSWTQWSWGLMHLAIDFF